MKVVPRDTDQYMFEGRWETQLHEVLTLRHGTIRSSVGWFGTYTVSEEAPRVASISVEWGASASMFINQRGQLIVTEWGLTCNRCGEPAKKGITRAMEESISKGTVALVYGSYIEDCWRQRQTLQKRQDLPSASMWHGPEAVEQWRQFGRLFLIIVSMSWLAADHPDPHLYQVRRLATAISKLKQHAGKFGVRDVAVAIDFCSLPQAPMSEVQQAQLPMKEFHLMYLHQDTTAIMLTAVPSYESRVYAQRGWCMFQEAVIDMKGGLASNTIVLDDTFDPDAEQSSGYTFISERCYSRSPPLTPASFQSMLVERREAAHSKGLKLFESSEDASLVVSLFTLLCSHVLSTDSLVYDDSTWGKLEACKLALVLRDAKLRMLQLTHCCIGHDGLMAILAAVSGKASLVVLHFRYVDMGPKGALDLACVVGKLPCLVSLIVFVKCGEMFDEVQLKQLCWAWEQAGKDPKELWLREDPTSDAGELTSNDAFLLKGPPAKVESPISDLPPKSRCPPAKVDGLAVHI
jgi:hypothetical protein